MQVGNEVERLIGILDALYARGDPARSQLLRTLGENDLDVPVALLADAYAEKNCPAPEGLDA